MVALLNILPYIGWVLLAIMILVFVHEMGHFLFAKLFKMRVDRFSVGFPPDILKKKIGDTEYVLAATPLGGYVKIAGMVDESMDTDFATSEPQPWEFRSKPVWQRIVVITAGVIFNFIFAAMIYGGLKYSTGDVYVPAENVRGVYVEEGSFMHDMGVRTDDRIIAVNEKPIKRFSELLAIDALAADEFSITVDRNGESIKLDGPRDLMTQLNRAGDDIGLSYSTTLLGSVIEGSPADSAGLTDGDRIIAINGVDVKYWGEMRSLIQASQGGPITVNWQRADAGSGEVVVHSADVVPEKRESSYTLGVYEAFGDLFNEEFGTVRNPLTAFESASLGVSETWSTGKLVLVGLKRVFTGRENLRESLGGPIAIARATKQARDQGWKPFWSLVAFLSVTLGVINIMPIPALDGGHLVFLLYEGITRREPSLKLRMALQNVGMIVLLAFMAFLIINDVLRLY